LHLVNGLKSISFKEKVQKDSNTLQLRMIEVNDLENGVISQCPEIKEKEESKMFQTISKKKPPPPLRTASFPHIMDLDRLQNLGSSKLPVPELSLTDV